MFRFVGEDMILIYNKLWLIPHLVLSSGLGEYDWLTVAPTTHAAKSLGFIVWLKYQKTACHPLKKSKSPYPEAQTRNQLNLSTNPALSY